MTTKPRFPLFIAQLKIPPAYQAVLWDGEYETMKEINTRYGLSGFIAMDSALEMNNPPEWKNRRVPVGYFLVFYLDSTSKTLIEVLNEEQTRTKYHIFTVNS